MADRLCYGNWEKIASLGYGTFGVVGLWENKVNQQKLAIKMCRPDLDLSPKNQQRWKQEIHILMQINHPNVIQAVNLPEDLKMFFDSNLLPALCMEYCEGGDLRKTLSTVENCCGLNMNMITKVCRDISCAIECLHGLGIAHRDLKPENIVICRSENKNIIFKVIDLGYAKQLDRSSSQHSHVGTPHYLAPEILKGSKSYNTTVDYWSYGCLLFECCTGVRPFDVVLSQNDLNSIANKESKYISAFIDDNCNDQDSQLKFSDSLPQVNQLNSVLQHEFVQLFRLLLDGSPDKRGGNGTWLECVKEITSSKIVSVFSISQCTEYTYKFTPDLSVSKLQHVIFNDTGIEQEKQDLFLIDGNDLGQELQPNRQIFLFNKDFKLEDRVRHHCQIPQSIVQLLQDPTAFVINKTLKQHIEVYRHGVYFFQKQRFKNSSMTRALKALIIGLLKSRQHLLDESSKFQEKFTELRATIEFFKSSLAFDLQRYNDLINHGVNTPQENNYSMVESWQGIDDKLKQNLILSKAEKVFEDRKSLQDDITAVRSHDQFNQIPRKCAECIQKRLEKIQEQYNQIKKPTGNSSCCKERIKDLAIFLEKFLHEMDEINEEFYKCFLHVTSLRKQLAEFFLQLKQLDNSVTEFKDDIKLMQEERQNDIWKLLSSKENVITSAKIRKEDKGLYKRSTSRIVNENQAIISKVKETLKTVKDQGETFLYQSQELDWSFLHV